MAKPDTDDGWFKLSDELFAAICVADFSKRAMIVIREVFEQWLGDDKKPEVYLDPVDIADRSGTVRTSIWKGITELVVSGVLVQVEPYRFRFVKDYTRWTRNGSVRLAGREQQYAREAPGRAHPRRRKPFPSGNATSGNVQSTNVDDPCLSGNSNGETAFPSGNGREPTACLSGNAPPIEERARSEIRELEIRDKQAEPVGPIAPEPTGEKIPDEELDDCSHLWTEKRIAKLNRRAHSDLDEELGPAKVDRLIKEILKHTADFLPRYVDAAVYTLARKRADKEHIKTDFGFIRWCCQEWQLAREIPVDSVRPLPRKSNVHPSGLPLVTTTQEERDRLDARKFRINGQLVTLVNGRRVVLEEAS